SPVDVDDRGAVGGPLVRLGALARGVDRRVLEQKDRVLPSRHDLLVHASLHLPGGGVVDRGLAEAGGLESQLVHRTSLCRRTWPVENPPRCPRLVEHGGVRTERLMSRRVLVALAVVV